MIRHRIILSLNCFLLTALMLTACSGGVPNLAALAQSTPTTPAPTAAAQQALPPALVETSPPAKSVIGHRSPITFYFNQGMNKSLTESALSGLPEGRFTWNDEATLLFTPTQPYAPNTTLKISVASSLQSASGFGSDEPVEIEFPVADYLRTNNILPKANAEDVVVDAAIAVSFNQPVVALGADATSLPAAFSIEPTVRGRGEWISTSTYIFYPDPPMVGGTEYTVRLNPDLKTVSGIGLPEAGGEGNTWTFTTSRPRVVSLDPASKELLALEPEIKLTFNQPMDKESVESNFSFSGTEGVVDGTFTWDETGTELTFVPEKTLARNVGYVLNLGKEASSQGSAPAITLGTDFGAMLLTYDNFAVTGTDPNPGANTFTFNSPLAEADYADAVKVTPGIDNLDVMVSEDDLGLIVFGNFIPETNYVLELSAQVRDRWGQSLGDPYIMNYRAPALPASVTVNSVGSSTLFVRPDEPVLNATVINTPGTNVTISPISLQDFLPLQDSFDNQQAYAPTSPTTFSQNFTLAPSQAEDVKLALTQQDNQLLPGLYYVNVTSPEIKQQFKNVYFVASSQVNLTFKYGATEAFVWAVDLPSQTPVVNAPIVIYDNTGTQLASGTTDSNGLWQGTTAAYSGQAYAVLGAPGEDNFALAVSQWYSGIAAWDFGYVQHVRSPYTKIYMYTDRPIYRAGHTVYFRGVVRQAFNGRYELPPLTEIPLNLRDANGTQLLTFNAQLSPYGTFNGQFELPESAVPGYYTFENSSLEFFFNFQVAEYRKSEINLSVDFSADEIRLGSAARANVSARYFFDAPAGNVDVRWALYAQPDFFSLPNYDTGILDTSWLDVFRFPAGFGPGFLGNFIEEGTGRTGPEGTLSIELPAIPEAEAGQIVTLEIIAQDESGLPVSARTEVRVHPADFYIGLRPDQWSGTAKEPIEFEVYTVDWAKNPSGNKTLTAEFKQVRWEQETDSSGFPTYTPVYTPVSSSNLTTGADGRARLSFVPPNPGTYMLDVSGAGARAQTLVWVGGAGSAAWPDLPNQRLELKADRQTYKAGDTAKIFIPNPFATKSLALLTVERGLVSKAEVITLSGSGREYSLPLTDEDAPNVYVSVTVLGQGNDFRQGLVNIPVAPDSQALNVEITSSPQQAGPRDNITFDVNVTDHEGQPVEGEFSVSVVDLATLALADPNSEDILPAFYSNQPLGVQTALSLAAYSGRNYLEPGGRGGGGGDAPPVLREDFPDTAYWNPALITNSEGRGQVTMTLPDSLTTWQVAVRGLTADTRVGETETQIVTTKPLLVRPVTPRFLVRGDHVLMAAILNNNTSNPLSVAVNLKSEGFALDEADRATQNVDIPANGRTRVEWWGTAGVADSADLIFSATSTGTPALQDSTRPVWGVLPILQYTSPQAFVTGGVLREASSQQEVISLPRTFTPNGGGLDVELSPSLAGSLLSALEAMEEPDYELSAESTLSYILPNVEVYRALNNAGLSDPELSARVTTSLNSGVSRLLSLQNNDGGWSWWRTFPAFEEVEANKSDPYISAYVFFGLLRARNVGVPMDEAALQRAGVYLRDLNPAITNDTKGAELDDITFIQFVLMQANSSDEAKINQLYEARDRLSPASKAFLALMLNSLNPADPRVRDIISNLESTAILSSSSAHWETPGENISTRGSTIYTTSVVVYALAQLDSANQVVFNAVRYLAAHRNAQGFWSSGHDNAWAMLALNEAMLGFGDLNADFTFNAILNDTPLASGDVAGNQVLAPLNSHVPIGQLAPGTPNLLTITRAAGLGRLYYSAALKVNRPVEDVQPMDEGMQIGRIYCEAALSETTAQPRDCTPLSTLQLASSKQITAQLTLILPHDSYYVMVEDFIPAGTEILDRSLKTSQQGIESTEVSAEVPFEDEDPFANGWGWWLFHEPQIRDDSILFAADYLPAGTYILTYTLIPLQSGEYRVLPAHAWQSFFPEVQGTSAGAVFEIKP